MSTRPSSVCFVEVYISMHLKRWYTLFPLQDLLQCKLDDVLFYQRNLSLPVGFCPLIAQQAIVIFETFWGLLHKSSVRGEIYIVLIEF